MHAQARQSTSAYEHVWAASSQTLIFLGKDYGNNAIARENRVRREVESYSRKAAKRALFWLEKNHWAQVGPEVLDGWVRDGMKLYLETGNKYLRLEGGGHQAWCTFELYLERLSRCAVKRRERESRTSSGMAAR